MSLDYYLSITYNDQLEPVLQSQSCLLFFVLDQFEATRFTQNKDGDTENVRS